MIKFFSILFFILFIFFLPYVINFISISRHFTKPVCTLSKLKKRALLLRLWWDLPRRYILDKYTLNPNKFYLKGVHIICGCQGSGKTITLTYILMQLKSKYPNLKIKTNYFYKYQDEPITHWKDIVSSTNGEYGEIDVLDEIQNWFNSLQSKDFPPEMLQEVTQQRKQVKCIFGTSQVFMRIAKPLREQIDYIYLPHTFMGCFTVVKVCKPDVSQLDGTSVKYKTCKWFCFVHNDKIRNAFDTYKKIETLSTDGFIDTSSQLSNIHVDFSVLDND